MQAKIHDEMTIYTPDGINFFEAPVTKEAIIKCVLMGDYYVELPFKLTEQKDFRRGCYILYQGRKFEIMSNVRPEFDNKTGGYKYALRFEAQQNHMKRRKVFWLRGRNAETCFHDTTTLEDFGTLIAANMNLLLGGENWKMAAVPEDLAKVTKLVSFNGDYCWDAINTIAQTFGCEWWTVENGNEVWLYFGKLEFGTPERFERGKAINSIPTKKGNDSNYGTRFFIFGSTRNLPENYNKTEQGGVTNHVSEVRLHLPNGLQYVDAWENLAPEDVVEQVAFFEDVFPKNTETVTSIETIKRKVENSEDKDRTFDAYIMYCTNTPFIPSDIYPGETLRCRFTSGSLNGREFDLAIIKDDDGHTVINPEKWKPEDGFNKKFEIIADTEQVGEEGIITIPNETLHPGPGDTFILTGVKLPQERIAEAEQELLRLGKTWARKNSSDTDIYDCPTNPSYCHRNNKNYELGQKVLLIDDRFGKEGRISRIQGFEKKLWHEYEATYTVGDNMSYSRLGNIETSITESAYAERIGVVSGVGVYLIRSKYDTTAPTDYNVYSAAAIEALFLNKIKGGTVSGKVRFAKDLTVDSSILSKDYHSGEFTGTGYKLGLDAHGNSILEVDKAIIRKEAIFNETVINQVSFRLGETVFSNGGCEITAVEELDDTYRCYYDNKEGRRYSGFEAGDQARCQRYDAGSKDVVKYYWRLVTAVGANYIELSKTDFDGTGIPAAGDNVVHFGNRDNTARQSAIVINPLDGGAVEIYSGVGSYSLSEKNRIGMGTNPATGEAYLYGHGNLYFGDQDMTDPESTWITFQKKEGSDRKKLYIKGNIEMGADTTGLQNVEEFKNLENKVDNLQIGNLNLLKNTRGFSEGWAGDGLLQQDKYLGLSVYYQTGVDSTDRYQDIRYQNTLLLPDTEYTLSFYAKGSGHLVTYVFPNALGQIIMTNGCPEWVGSKPTDGHCEYPLSSEWKRYFVTFRTTDDTTQLSPSGTSKTVLFRVLKGPNEAYICGAKLEKGNVHSDWSPAPEDADNSGLQFIKQIFPNGLINNIATVSQLLAVRNSMDTNANIVAGIYGGGVKKLEDNGFKHNVYGKLMIFAGAENIDKVGQAKTRIYEDGTIITNKLIAEGGQIGGFNISAIQLSATTYTKDDYDKDVFNSEMVLSANYIRFRDKDCRIIIGSQTTVGTQMIFPVQINVNRITNNTTPLQQNIGISLNVSGAQTYDGAAEHGNHAISINQGHICGFRLKTRRISSSQLISPLDNILLVTASITLTLPAYPEDGQMYIIKNITSAANTTLKVGATGHYLNNGKYNRITQFQWNTGVILMAIWDAVNKIWQLGWTNIG
jgi:hypothetical protein